jgi:hypothetical protein
MKRIIFTLYILCISGVLSAQPGRNAAMPKLNTPPQNLLDSTLLVDSSKIITRRVNAFYLTDKLGDRYAAPIDTTRINYANQTLVEGRGLAISYLANMGSPAQSRIFAEREEDNDFIFRNPYYYYITTPLNAKFYDVKDPYTLLRYHRAGGQLKREEIFEGLLTTNLGRKINIGVEFNYTYVRGHYSSNNNMMLYYRPFASYTSDRYEVHAYLDNFNYLNSENGGMTNDRYITNYDDFTAGKTSPDSKDFPVRFSGTWNRVKGKRYYLTHRYNLGFYREMTKKEEEERERLREEKRRIEEAKRQQDMEQENDKNEKSNTLQPISPEQNMEEYEEEIDAVFVPVSSIIHIFDFEGSNRRFISKMTALVDTSYNDLFANPDSTLNDFTSSWNMKNTIGLSLREGFQDWIKFGLTAYALFEKRRFTLPADSVVGATSYDEFSSFLGAELSSRRGKLFQYNARGEFCLAGSDMGEFRLNGELTSKFKLMKRDASVKLFGYLKNYTPAFYLRHHHSRYYWWDNSLKNIQELKLGGEVFVKQTGTTVSTNIQSIQNYTYFDLSGVPEQFGSNLQVVNVRLKQDFRYKAFGWENEVAYQVSSDKSVLPLPQISAYSNIYLDFTYAKILNIQLGADAHYFTSYYAPYYDPATQQFRLQDEKKIGNYPIINVYANFHLKQTTFFLTGYNMSSLFISPANYFSSLHYPLNPMVIKMGLCVFFNN